MKYTIYQTTNHNTVFCSLDELKHLSAKFPEMDLSIKKEDYKEVYSGEVPTTPADADGEILEELFTKFNMDRPADYAGHSMSVSDIVALESNGETRYYYCDSFSWEPIEL